MVHSLALAQVVVAQAQPGDQTNITLPASATHASAATPALRTSTQSSTPSKLPKVLGVQVSVPKPIADIATKEQDNLQNVAASIQNQYDKKGVWASRLLNRTATPQLDENRLSTRGSVAPLCLQDLPQFAQCRFMLPRFTIQDTLNAGTLVQQSQTLGSWMHPRSMHMLKAATGTGMLACIWELLTCKDH